MTSLSYLLQLLNQNPPKTGISEVKFAEFLNQPKTEQLLQQLINWEAEVLAEWETFSQKKNEKTNNDSNVFTFELDPRIEEKVEDLFSTSAILRENLVLPNAILDKNYRYYLDFKAQGLEDVQQYEMEGLEEAGLEWDTDSSTIYGIPYTEGEFSFFIKYKLFHHTEKNPYQYKKLILNVLAGKNKPTFKNIPSHEEEKYWKPDEMKTLIWETERQLFAASKRGLLHENEGEIRSDDFGVFYDKNTKWYIMSVASGAQNAKFGRKGAQIAAKSGISFLANKIRDDYEYISEIIIDFIQHPTETQELGEMLYSLLGGAVLEVSRLLEEEGREAEESHTEYAASVAFLIAKRTPKGWAMASIGIGDNSIVLFQADELKVLHNLSDFSQEDITQVEVLKNLHKRLRFHLVTDFEGLMLFTEGVKSYFFPQEQESFTKEDWQEIWQELSAKMRLGQEPPEMNLRYLMDWLREIQTESDSTIALLW